MRLVFIYGPPSSGKYTVANELSKLTCYKNFHNHLTVDFLSKFFKFGSKAFCNLNEKLRLELFKSFAKENTNGLIFTFCYAHPEDIKFVKKVKALIDKYNGKVFFVQLYCDRKELKKRVIEKSRKKHRKIKTTKLLDEVLQKWDLFVPIPFVKSLRIDNTNISAKEVAKKIKSHYNL